MTPRPLNLVQTPATVPPPPARSVEGRVSQALKSAWQSGYDAAERVHYVQGWRHGIGHGLVSGILLGCLAMWAAVQIGRMVG